MREQSKAETFVGGPCKYRHDGTRYRSTGACVQCVRRRGEQERAKGPPSARAVAEGYCSPDHGRALLLAQHGGCAYCGDTRRLELDHRISIAEGGTHWPGNRQWLCRFHNRNKRATRDGRYRRRLGIIGRTAWDADPVLVEMIDADARAMVAPLQIRAKGLTQLDRERRARAFALTHRRSSIAATVGAALATMARHTPSSDATAPYPAFMLDRLTPPTPSAMALLLWASL